MARQLLCTLLGTRITLSDCCEHNCLTKNHQQHVMESLVSGGNFPCALFQEDQTPKLDCALFPSGCQSSAELSSLLFVGPLFTVGVAEPSHAPHKRLHSLTTSSSKSSKTIMPKAEQPWLGKNKFHTHLAWRVATAQNNHQCKE